MAVPAAKSRSASERSPLGLHDDDFDKLRSSTLDGDPAAWRSLAPWSPCTGPRGGGLSPSNGSWTRRCLPAPGQRRPGTDRALRASACAELHVGCRSEALLCLWAIGMGPRTCTIALAEAGTSGRTGSLNDHHVGALTSSAPPSFGHGAPASTQERSASMSVSASFFPGGIDG